MSTPFLSICIPTYNRSTILKKTIESIISQKIFIETDLIELIISDNASTDETPLVAESFSKLFPQKIKYIRLDHPIDSHFNFENALKHGNGKFVKLLADATCFSPTKLDQLVYKVLKYNNFDIILTQSIPEYFGQEKTFSKISDILNYYSFSLSWISIYCFKKDVLFSLTTPFRYWNLFFPHIDILFRLLEAGSSVICLNDNYFSPQQKLYINRNDAHIFGECYLQLLEIYKEKNEISQALYLKEMRNVLFWQIIPFYFDAGHYRRKEKHQGYWVFWKSLPRYHTKIYPCLIIYFELRKIPFISQICLFSKKIIVKLLFRKIYS